MSGKLTDRRISSNTEVLMTPENTTLRRKDTAYRSLTQIIVELIRQGIYEGTYKPGTRLNIADLAQSFSASAVPVREALRNLEAEGLVEFRPNRGVVIKELSASEVRELFLMRLPLEMLAATQATLKPTPSHGPHRGDPEAHGRGRRDEEWHVLHDSFTTNSTASPSCRG